MHISVSLNCRYVIDLFIFFFVDNLRDDWENTTVKTGFWVQENALSYLAVVEASDLEEANRRWWLSTISRTRVPSTMSGDGSRRSEGRCLIKLHARLCWLLEREREIPGVCGSENVSFEREHSLLSKIVLFSDMKRHSWTKSVFQREVTFVRSLHVVAGMGEGRARRRVENVLASKSDSLAKRIWAFCSRAWSLNWRA